MRPDGFERHTTPGRCEFERTSPAECRGERARPGPTETEGAADLGMFEGETRARTAGSTTPCREEYAMITIRFARMQGRDGRLAIRRGFRAMFLSLVAATSAWGQGPRQVVLSRETNERSPTRADADPAGLFRFEPTGLSLLRPYRRGKIPVLFVHGLWSGPWSWSRMIEDLEADPEVKDRFQFWTYGYSTGDPILYSASLLRRDLEEVRRKFDPAGTDAAFDRIVVVGHSLGGLLAKMMVQDSGDPAVADHHQRSAFRRARGRPGRPWPLPPLPVLQAPTGGPPRGLHRHAAPRQPGRSGPAARTRLASGPRPRSAPGRA